MPWNVGSTSFSLADLLTVLRLFGDDHEEIAKIARLTPFGWFEMTISTHQLYKTEPPFLHVAHASVPEMTRFGWSLIENTSLNVVARFLRGTKMPTVSSLFDEFTAAIQFPYYFSENWDAFEECISDFSWLPADCYILIVTDADNILRDAPMRDFVTLIDILQNAGQEWSNGNSQNNPKRQTPAAFHTVFQVQKSRARDLVSRLNSVKAPFDELSLTQPFRE
jgi:hypothetical protein